MLWNREAKEAGRPPGPPFFESLLNTSMAGDAILLAALIEGTRTGSTSLITV
jgi:hypothetical protein